jgi:hypothetical protein
MPTPTDRPLRQISICRYPSSPPIVHHHRTFLQIIFVWGSRILACLENRQASGTKKATGGHSQTYCLELSHIWVIPIRTLLFFKWRSMDYTRICFKPCPN